MSRLGHPILVVLDSKSHLGHHILNGTSRLGHPGWDVPFGTYVRSGRDILAKTFRIGRPIWDVPSRAFSLGHHMSHSNAASS